MKQKQRVNTEQSGVITNLNKYLAYHNLPITLDEKGICHGLSTLYIQYVLDGKEEEFTRILSYIAHKTPQQNGEIHDADLFILVEKLIALHVSKPHETRNTYNQSNSYQQLHVNNHYLQSAFQIGVKTSTSNWASIIEQIDLQPTEVLRATCTRHTIAIARDANGDYRVYDPNNSVVSQRFTSAEKMTKWLANQAFNFSMLPTRNKALDMHIDVISAVQPENRVFPSKKELLDKYLTPSQMKIHAELKGGLYYAMEFDDAEAAEYILNDETNHLSEKELRSAVVFAVKKDSAHVLEVIIRKLEKENRLSFLEPFTPFSFTAGSARCAHLLLSMKETHSAYESLVKDQATYSNILKYAFSGMHDDLIRYALIDVQKYHGAETFTPEILTQLLDISVQNRNPRAITLLGNHLTDLHKQVDDPQQRLDLLTQAIKNNDPLMVKVLIRNLKMSAEELNCLNISLTMIHQHNFEIFTTLKDAGYQFSPRAEQLIQSKMNQSIGLIESLGIALIRFSEFITQQNTLQIDPSKVDRFTLFKAEVTSFKEEKRAQEQDEEIEQESPEI